MPSPQQRRAGEEAYKRNGLAPYTKATKEYRAKYERNGEFVPIPKKGTHRHKEWLAMAKKYM